jgi:diguanylate cyclase (GGDEF)-like protein
MLSSAVPHGIRLGSWMIDVDNFQAVNDRYGHFVGDKILKGVATRIRNESGRNRVVSATNLIASTAKPVAPER